MASAVLPSRNEPYWGESEVYMRHVPNKRTNNPHLNARLNPKPNPSSYPNPIYNPKFNYTRQIPDLAPKTHLRQRNQKSPRPPPLPPPVINDSQSLNRRIEGKPILPKDPFHREYVTFHLSSYSRTERKELKKRLISDIVRVRSLLTRIETRSLEICHSSQSSQFRAPAADANYQPSDPQAEKRNTTKGSQKNRSFPKGKKNKKFSGQKRGLALVDSRETKRPAVATTEADQVLRTMMKKCKQILLTLMKQKFSWVFNKPVNVERLRLHDYYEVIKQPMDLGTVKSKLSKNVYQSPLDFASDVRLTFGNAMKYNPKGQDVHILAESLLSIFEQMFAPEFQQYEAGYRRLVAEKVNRSCNWVQLDQPVMIPEPILLSSPSGQNEQVSLAPVLQDKKGKLSKPKAKDPNKRPMTDEEKARLGSNLQNIPEEKMEQMVHIVRERNSHLVQEGDEIELDFEALDNETLWDLDRFVTYHMKALSKLKRQEIVEDATLIQQASKSPVSEPHQEMAVEKNKKWEAGEEDVDIGEEIPANDFPPVEIERDVEIDKGIAGASTMEIDRDAAAAASGGSSSSSSSSSSSDDSTASDSDSGSSSGSDSDEDSVQSPYVEPKGIPVNSVIGNDESN